jgi:hypothetical protein
MCICLLIIDILAKEKPKRKTGGKKKKEKENRCRLSGAVPERNPPALAVNLSTVWALGALV